MGGVSLSLGLELSAPAVHDWPVSERDLLRHTLATLAYRGAKALRDAPVDFAGFRAEIETGRVGRDQAAPARELD